MASIVRIECVSFIHLSLSVYVSVECYIEQWLAVDDTDTYLLNVWPEWELMRLSVHCQMDLYVGPTHHHTAWWCHSQIFHLCT